MTIVLVVGMTLTASAAKKQTSAHGYPINPVPFTSVKVTPAHSGASASKPAVR